MQIDYNTPPRRRGTGSIKWDRTPHPDAPELIPLWVADMDFPAPPEVIRAIQERAAHGVFGYTQAGESSYRALDGWFSRRFGLSVKPETVTISPGIVPAVHSAVRAFTESGEGVIIQNPVYYPFVSAVQDNGRQLLVNNLLEDSGRYSIDFDDLSRLAAREEAKLLVLCSPHNPVGRVWSRQELERVAEICLSHGVLVVSDEIHCDLLMPDAPRRHTPYNLISPEAAETSILCTAPSKSFNIPGLATSNIIIENREHRRAFRQEINRSASDLPNCFGAVACEAAYNYGEPWLEETLAYIQGNRDFLIKFLAEQMPELSISPLEATYLPWIDVRPLLKRRDTDSQTLERYLVDKAGVWLEAGSIFGQSGEGFMRVNIACSRPLLEEALSRIEKALC